MSHSRFCEWCTGLYAHADDCRRDLAMKMPPVRAPLFPPFAAVSESSAETEPCPVCSSVWKSEAIKLRARVSTLSSQVTALEPIALAAGNLVDSREAMTAHPQPGGTRGMGKR